jgi:acetyl-CoA/propionyl-CoA carboxylase biotin carboxyl carrier protein
MLGAVLVANRGEIALRVIRTLRRLGIRSIAVYSDADAAAPHVRAADEAIRLGPPAAAQSYLAIERILDAAGATGAEAIHPGYGFLSENAGFARACSEAGIVFIGPSAEAMEALGDKVRAKEAALAAGVPVLPGLQRPGLSDDEIAAFVADGGVLPLMVKAASGGGGRGMRVVRAESELREALGAARREALAGFADDTLLVERFVPSARHIEVQVFADAHGGVVHLGERECSLQRRHQKVIEESPSPAITSEVRERLGAAAVGLFAAVGYVGAGTAEFLVPADSPDEFFFLEVNARLQVEHPVTEAVTGLDLVELQLRIASGEPLGFTQSEVVLTGHAIEARICAEDPTSGFLPATGTLLAYREPAGVRVDSGVEHGSVVGSDYDSLLAKVIAHAPDRTGALEQLSRALGELRILGVATNGGFLARLINAPEVRVGAMDTGLIERGVAAVEPDPATARAALDAAAQIEAFALTEAGAGGDPWDALVGFRLEGSAPIELRLQPTHAKEPVSVLVDPPAGARRVTPDSVALVSNGRRVAWTHAGDGNVRWVSCAADSFAFTLAEPTVLGADAVSDGALEAPMPGLVLAVRAEAGDAVAEGDVLVVIESMKMELSLTAPAAATVSAVHVDVGQSVKQGQAVVELEADQ